MEGRGGISDAPSFALPFPPGPLLALVSASPSPGASELELALGSSSRLLLVGGSCTESSELDAIFDAFAEGDPGEIVPEEELPFRRLKLTPEEEEEEDMDAVRKGEPINVRRWRAL